jgi:choline/glycine/proline betaine transport protein
MVAAMFADLQAIIVAAASWFYVLVIALMAVMVLVLSVSRYGDIKLGRIMLNPTMDSYPGSLSFSLQVSVLDCCFNGVAEPVLHFLSPPVGEGGTEAAAAGAMQLTYLHWGFNAWATYAAVAMVLAYFSYRHNLPLTLRSAFYPLIGDRIYGPMGASVDVFAVICTTCGISVSLGLGVLQINTGLNYLFGVAIDAWVQVLLIFATMAVATVSVIMGLDSGIKRLSEINTVLAVSLLLLILLAGPTALLLSGTLQNFGGYIASVVPRTLISMCTTLLLTGWRVLEPFSTGGGGSVGPPFVGIFGGAYLQREDIREFLIGVTVVRHIFVCLWAGACWVGSGD